MTKTERCRWMPLWLSVRELGQLLFICSVLSNYEFSIHFLSPRVCLFVSHCACLNSLDSLNCFVTLHFFLFFHAFFFFFVLVWNASWHDSATGLENKRDREVHYATLKNTCTNTQIKESLSTEVEDGDKHVFSPNLHTHTPTHTGGVNFFSLVSHTHTHTRVHAHTFRGMHMHTLKTQWSS